MRSGRVAVQHVDESTAFGMAIRPGQLGPDDQAVAGPQQEFMADVAEAGLLHPRFFPSDSPPIFRMQLQTSDRSAGFDIHQ